MGVIANVSVNGVKIGYLDNLYRTYFLKIKSSDLIVGFNTLRIDIASTVEYTYVHHANYT